MCSSLIWCYLIVVTTCSVLPAFSNRLDAEETQNHNILLRKGAPVLAQSKDLLHSTKPANTQASHRGFSVRKRKKRGLILAGLAALRGLKAKMRLMIGTKKIPSEKEFIRLYVKKGDYQQTLKDFYSVKPFDVQHSKLPNGADVVIGKVGDRTLMAQSFGGSDSRPSLSTSKTKIVEELSPRKLSKSGIDRIIYVD